MTRRPGSGPTTHCFSAIGETRARNGESGCRPAFDTLFKARTGHATLDRLLESLIANKAELLRVLDHPDIPLSTNIVERDIRAHVTRRKLSAGTRSEPGRQARDAGLGILKTCGKLGVSFSDYLADRFGMAGAPAIPKLADLIMQRSTA